MNIRKHLDTQLLIFLTVLALLVTVVAGQVQSAIGWKALVIAIILVGSIFYIVSHIMINIVGDNLDKRVTLKINEAKCDLDEAINDNHSKLNEVKIQLDRSIDDHHCKSENFINTLVKVYNIGTIPDWILTTEELLKFESENAKSEVWIVTSDLLEDGIDGPFFNVVTSNLKKGVIYRYFLPSGNMLRLQIDRMKKKLGKKLSAGIDCYYLNDDFFFLFSKFDFGIINPDACCGTRYGFMGINTPDDSNNRFQIRIPDILVDEFIAKLVDEKKKYKS